MKILIFVHETKLEIFINIYTNKNYYERYE